MIVRWQIARLNLEREGRERPAKGRQNAVKLLRVSSACFEIVAQDRQVAIDRVKQPKSWNITGSEIGQAGAALSAVAGENTAFRREDLNEPTRDAYQEIAGSDA